MSTAVVEAPERATLTVEQTAKVLGISRGNAYEGVRKGLIPALRIGARWVVPRPALNQMLAGNPPARGDEPPTQAA